MVGTRSVRGRLNRDEGPEESRGGGRGGGGSPPRRGGGKKRTTNAAASEEETAVAAAAVVKKRATGTTKAPSTKPPPSSSTSSSASLSTTTVLGAGTATTASSRTADEGRGAVRGQVSTVGIDVALDGTHPNGKAVGAPSAALISSRTHAFSADTWWLVDLEADPPQGATRLVKSCMHAYQWDCQKARSVLRAYRQFLFLKKTYEDYDAKILSPSRTVDMMWHQHILDVVNYVHDCALLCNGRVVGHDPRGSEQGPERDERRAATGQALLRHKDEIGIENDEWKELLDGNGTGSPATATAAATATTTATAPAATAAAVTAAAAPAPRTAVAPSPAGETLELVVKMPGGARFSIYVRPDDGRLSDVFDAVVSKTGITATEFRLFTGGRRLLRSNGSSPRAFGLVNKSVIVQEKAILIRLLFFNRTDAWFKVWPDSGKMSSIYDAASERMETPSCDLRFYLMGRRIADGEISPRTAGLEDYSVLEVLSAMRGC